MKIVIDGRWGLENGITHVFFWGGGGGGDCKDYLLPFS